MKIRNHFISLTALFAAIPIFYLLGETVYHHFFTPAGTVFSKAREVRAIEEMDFSDADTQMLLKTVRERPSDMEDAFVFSDGKVLISTIREFEGMRSMDISNFLKIATNPSDGVLYQITTLPSKSGGTPLLYITKFAEADFHKNRGAANISESTRRTIIICSVIVEIICIAFAMMVSARITKSIAMLENDAERLADGKFENPISFPKDFIMSNEITALSQNLETLRLTLKDQQNRRNRLIMGVSHDLKTPLSIIKGYAEAMASGIMPQSKAAETLDLIIRKAEQINDMIEELIDFVKLNSAQWLDNLTEVDLSEFLTKRAKLSEANFTILRRRFVSTMQIPKGTMVKMDEQLLERAIQNLFSNAVRYSRDGDTICINSVIKDGAAEISISDTGIGIAKDEAELIFDIFYKVSPSRREEGLGIGLAVVKNIVDTHDWSIKVESELGAGSVFTITIPLSSANARSFSKPR